jgi:hypothetical protein
MTNNEHQESKRNVYDTCDPKYLRELREASGMDLVVLARTACLSVAQVRQLESDDSDNLFYSDAIKRQAYKRLLMILGAEPPTVEIPQDLRDAGKVADVHLNTLDQIVAMSHQPAMNRSASDAFSAGFENIKAHKQVVGALVLLVVAVVLFVLHGPQKLSEAADKALDTKPSAVESISSVAAASAEPTVIAASAAAPVASAVVVVAPAPAVVVASAPASTPVVVASTNASAKSDACAYSSETMAQVTPFIVQKEGRYVYLVSGANTDVCVVDGNKQATVLQLKTGENRSVYGVSPWQVSSPNLQKVQIYFQGGRVSLPDATATRVKLVEVPIAR